jgi:hypothetical protein
MAQFVSRAAVTSGSLARIETTQRTAVLPPASDKFEFPHASCREAIRHSSLGVPAITGVGNGGHGSRVD